MSARNVLIILVGMVCFGNDHISFLTEGIPSLFGAPVYSDLTTSVTSNEFGGTGKL